MLLSGPILETNFISRAVIQTQFINQSIEAKSYGSNVFIRKFSKSFETVLIELFKR